MIQNMEVRLAFEDQSEQDGSWETRGEEDEKGTRAEEKQSMSVGEKGCRFQQHVGCKEHVS